MSIKRLKVDVEKKWGTFNLRVKFSLKQGELLTILGPSGCGKSTLLNLIAGVVEPDNGEIKYDNVLLYKKSKNINQAISNRKIAYIQQKSNLFPHLTVMQNISYGVKGKVDKAEIEKIMNLLGIDFLKGRWPKEISGGQMQRVSLARALMVKPRILLFDEPFSALDNLRRLRLRETILDIKDKLQIPMIFVTHDLEEAYELGDKVAVMDKGVFLQMGCRDEVYRNPIDAIVAEFVGMKNIIKGKVTRQSSNGLTVQTSDVSLEIPPFQCNCGEKIVLGIRPEDVMLVKEDKEVGRQIKDNIFSACVIKKSSGTENCKLILQLPNKKLKLEMLLPNHVVQKYKIELGGTINISLKKNCIAVLSKEKRNVTVNEEAEVI